MTDKARESQAVIDEVQARLHAAEQTVPRREVCCADLEKILEAVYDHFANGLPATVEEAVRDAHQICRDKNIARSNRQKRLFGLGQLLLGALLLLTAAVGLLGIVRPDLEQTALSRVWRGWMGILVKPDSFSAPEVTFAVVFAFIFGAGLFLSGVYFFKRATRQKVHVLAAVAIVTKALRIWAQSHDPAPKRG